jgi:hypothetical protein
MQRWASKILNGTYIFSSKAFDPFMSQFEYFLYYRYKSIRKKSAFYFLRQFFQVISDVFLELSVTTPEKHWFEPRTLQSPILLTKQ